MDSTEPTQKEHDSSAPEMARVPFVGRLHLYLPLPTKSFPYFSSAPASKPLGAAVLDGTAPTPPLTPPVSEPEKELGEYEEVAPVAGVAPGPSKKPASDTDGELMANDGPFMETSSQEYLALAFSFLFLVIESFLRIITIALREFFSLSLFISFRG